MFSSSASDAGLWSPNLKDFHGVIRLSTFLISRSRALRCFLEARCFPKAPRGWQPGGTYDRVLRQIIREMQLRATCVCCPLSIVCRVCSNDARTVYQFSIARDSVPIHGLPRDVSFGVESRRCFSAWGSGGPETLKCDQYQSAYAGFFVISSSAISAKTISWGR